LEEIYSTVRRELSEMEYSATQDIIVQIKEIAKARHLNAAQVKEIVDATGYVLSDTVYYRIFRDGSELNDSFNYEHTLRPILNGLVPYHGDDAVAQARSDAFLAVSRYKDEKIAALEAQLEHLRDQYETRMAFLRDQIELKDERMDRKDGIIEKLLDQVLVCGKCTTQGKEKTE